MKAAFGAVAALAALATGTDARAQNQTISNTATVQWQAGNSTVVRSSNRVDIAVGTIVPPTLSLSTFQFSGNTNAAVIMIAEKGADMIKAAAKAGLRAAA